MKTAFVVLLLTVASHGLRLQSTDNDLFACHDGSKTIDTTHVNDGVCDCEDGSDELESMHCLDQRFSCGPPDNFKLVFKSRVGDGNCDCCDGRDETAGACEDTCSDRTRLASMHHVSNTNVIMSLEGNSTEIASNMDDYGESAEYIDPWSGDLNADGTYANPNSAGAASDDLVDSYMRELKHKKPTIVVGRPLNEVVPNSWDNYGRVTKPNPIVGPSAGYYTQPTITKDRVVFVSEDELYSVPLAGGLAKVITAGVGLVWSPKVSPCGTKIAFSGSDEGSPDVYVIPINGGLPKRLTYMGNAMVVSWTVDGTRIIFSTSNSRFHGGSGEELFIVPVEGGEPKPYGVGWSRSISFGKPVCADDKCTKKHTPSVLGRFTSDITGWKRYRGGKRGKAWIDLRGVGNFEPLIDVPGNIGLFAWVHDFVFFVYEDCEANANPNTCVGNLFMIPVNPPGHEKSTPAERAAARFAARKKITSSTDYYVRDVSAWWGMDDHDASLVFTIGLDIYTLKVSKTGPVGSPKLLNIDYVSSREQRRHRFVPATSVANYDLSPDGLSVAYTSRGRLFVQPIAPSKTAIQLGETQGVRYSNAEFLSSGDLLGVSDETTESALEIFKVEGSKSLQSERIAGGRIGSSFGRVEELAASPTDDVVAIINHEYNLYVLDIGSGQIVCSVQSKASPGITDVSWSPDGAWIAFTFFVSNGVSVVKIMRIKDFGSGSLLDVCGVVDITDPLVRDHSPSWDPDGEFLYFLSSRDFTIQQDEVSPREMSFVGTYRPFLVTLNAARMDPFRDDLVPTDQLRLMIKQMKANRAKGNATEVIIDLTNIKNRLVAFPTAPGRYSTILGLPDKVVLYVRHPLEPRLSGSGLLCQYDFLSRNEMQVAKNIGGLTLSHNRQYASMTTGMQICLFPTAFRRSASPDVTKCLDTASVQFEIIPHQEWRQIFMETWRRARDNFWTRSMNGLDWDEVLRKYLPMLDRVNSRSELTDLIKQLHGDLGTSHAFHKDFSHRRGNSINVGRLGCDVEWDSQYNGYRIVAIYKGDIWSYGGGPLAQPGVNIHEGDVILSIDSIPVSRTAPLNQLLLGKAGQVVHLSYAKFAVDKVEAGFVRKPLGLHAVELVALPMDGHLRYRDWVNQNREYVHKLSHGRVGYLHVPSMSQSGWAEFYRSFPTESAKDGVIIDVRYNSGGFISASLSDKISRRTLGFMKGRWSSPEPYPHFSTSGPRVILINEGCASDCEIFSTTVCSRLQYHVPCLHDKTLPPNSCKRIGERTWGGVVGINWKGDMMDNSRTSQPEFAYWFIDKEGWGVENKGVTPDMEVLYDPNQFIKMYHAESYSDPYLVKAVEHIGSTLDDPEYKRRQQMCIPDLRLGERAAAPVTESELARRGAGRRGTPGGEAEKRGQDGRLRRRGQAKAIS